MIPDDPSPEDVNRYRKVQRLADAAVALFGTVRFQNAARVTIKVLVDLDQNAWKGLALSVGVNPPSLTTQADVIERLRERVEAEETARRMTGKSVLR